MEGRLGKRNMTDGDLYRDAIYIIVDDPTYFYDIIKADPKYENNVYYLYKTYVNDQELAEDLGGFETVEEAIKKVRYLETKLVKLIL